MRAGERGLDDHLIESIDHELLFLGLPAPPRRHAGQFQFLAEQMPAQAWKEGEQRRAFSQARAKGVGHGDVSRPRGLHQSRHAEKGIAAQLDRIAERVINPAQDDIDRLQAFERLQEDALIAHGQITAFDQSESKVTSQVGVLEIGFVKRAGREQHHMRIIHLARRQPPERVATQLKK